MSKNNGPPNASGSRTLPRNRHSAAKTIAWKTRRSHETLGEEAKSQNRLASIQAACNGLVAATTAAACNNQNRCQPVLACLTVGIFRLLPFIAWRMRLPFLYSFIALFICLYVRVCNLLLPPLYAASASLCVRQLYLTVDSFIACMRSYNFFN